MNDFEVEGTYVFESTGEVASIKAHDEVPADDDDLFIRWAKNEPNNFESMENRVVLHHTFEFFDANQHYPNITAACEIPNPHCFEGTCYFNEEINNKCFQ